MSLDATAKRVAIKLLGKYGKLVTITSEGVPTYDPSTGVAVSTPASVTTRGVIEKYNSYNLPNSNVKVGDEKIIVAGALVPFSPKFGDKVVIEAETFAVQNCESIYSGELVALYELAGRKS